MFAGIPIIGLAGGIGSGKSYVAKLFGELGCVVVDSDTQVHAAYRDPAVSQTLNQWWVAEVFDAYGGLNRAAVAPQSLQQRRRTTPTGRFGTPTSREGSRCNHAGGSEPARPAATSCFHMGYALLFEAGIRPSATL